MSWNDNQQGNRYKLVVWYYPTELRVTDTFWAFLGEEKKGTAPVGLERRIIQKKALNRYKTAILYDNGNPVTKWQEGIKVQLSIYDK